MNEEISRIDINNVNYKLKDEDTRALGEMGKQALIKVGYYVCSTQGSTAAKTIGAADYTLSTGGCIKVKMNNKNTANNATLNINSQGAKALYYQGERASATNSWDDNDVVEIYYDGTNYYANNVKGGSSSGVYDVSVEHPNSGPNSDGKFTLEYILNSNNVNELIPVNKRRTGMSIQFVSTDDNKYVQFRYMETVTTSATFTNVTNWQGVDKNPVAGSRNLTESGGVKDADDNMKIHIQRLNQLTGLGYDTFEGIYDGNSQWIARAGTAFYIIPIKPSDRVVITASQVFTYAFLADFVSPVNGQSPIYCSGCGRVTTSGNSVTLDGNIPNDVKFLYVIAKYPNVNYNISITVNGVSYIATNVQIEQVNERIAKLIAAGYAFSGFAVTETNPGTPSDNCFYIVRGAGTYTHFLNMDSDPIVIAQDGIYVFTYEAHVNNYWVSSKLIGIDGSPTGGSINLLTSNGARNADDNMLIDIHRLNRAVGFDRNEFEGFYDGNAKWLATSNTSFYIIPIKSTDNIKIEAGRTFMYSFLKDFVSPVNGVSPIYCNGTGRVTTTESSVTLYGNIPSDVKYLYVISKYNGSSYEIKIEINGETANIYNQINNGFAPYFTPEKMFGLTNKYQADQIRKSIVKFEVFDYFDVPTRIGIYALGHVYNSTLDQLLFYLADCDNLGDNDVIPVASVFAQVNYDLHGLRTGVIRVPVTISGVLFGYITFDLDIIVSLGYVITSGTPTTFANSAVSYMDRLMPDNVFDIPKKLTAFDMLDGWGVKLKGNANSFMNTNLNDIVLSTEGDSIEIELGDIYSDAMNNGGYAFTKPVPIVGEEAVRGIFVYRSGFRVRFDDKTWAESDVIPFSPYSKLKIEYADGNVLFYVNNELVNTYVGQKSISILGFGNGINSQFQTYWSGVIKSVKVNGVDLNLMHDLIWGTDTLFFRDNGFLSDSQASLLGQSYQELYAEKTATKLSIYKKLYNNLYVRYALEYTYSAYVQDAYPSYYDVWGVNVPVLCSFNGEDFTDIAALFRSAEAEMAIRLPRSGGDESQTYVGGDFHGFENIVSDNDVRQFRILVDNVKIEETGTFSLRPIVSASIIQKSELCQAYSNSNPFARVLKEWHFDRNGIEITTSLEILRSVTFMNAMLGMFGVYRHWLGNSSNPYLTNRVVKDDNIFTEYDISDGWENVAANAPLKTADINCRKMTLWGQYPYGFALQIIEPTVKPNGGMKIATNGSTYNKVYYDLTGTYTTEANEKLSCTQKWVIE